MTRFSRFAVSAPLALILVLPVSATADNVNATLPTIPVQGVRNPQEFDFANAPRYLKRFSAVPLSERDKARLLFVATGKRMTPLPPDVLSKLRLDIENRGESWPVEIKETGEVVFPEIPAAKVNDAQVVANVPKGTLLLSMRVRIVPSAEAVTLGYLNDAALQARAGWKRASGGIAALTVPHFTCAKFRFSRPKSIAITQEGKQIWAAPPGTEIDVPLSIPGASDRAEVLWPRDSDDQISGCKLN
ncbi:hypothetical protein [Lysobacter arvi]|uniref:Uncharacterized protein n=1 Tax=Lysobacter arvi TaxID=3038776 RepID=A0ABU1CFN0_9GAMM|nr:hypothetical protein [Lysobacter arvi]MDR0183765.1 hypothetical protein [Lysobacter arvi]